MLFLLLRASGDISDCNWLQLEQNDTIDIKQKERMHIRNNICSTFNPKDHFKTLKIINVKPVENFPSSFDKADIFISMPMENLCVLTIHNTKDTDGGKWVCHITSKSDDNEKNILENTGSNKKVKIENI